MNSNFEKSFNDWYKHIDKDKYYTVLTDDIDSYLSCRFLQNKFGIDIGGFYNFESLYVNSEVIEGKQPIYVDADVTSGYAFGNHVTGIKNPDCINLNHSIATANYTDKYAGSTLFTLYSLYGVDLTKYPRDKIQLLLTVDVWFKQYFCYRDKWDYWVKAMGMEYLTDIISDYTINDYYNILTEYKVNADIQLMPDGTLYFPLDYDGIKEDFGVTVTEPERYVFDMKVLDLTIGHGDLYQVQQKKARVFSNAMTYKNSLRYSLIMKGSFTND